MSKHQERKDASAAQNTELQMLAKKYRGELRPPQVVKFAKNPKTALHACFIWDDTRAAHLYRLIQAGHLIRVKVTLLRGPEGELVKVPQYVPFTKGGNIVYREVESVLSNPQWVKEREETIRRQVQSVLRENKALEKLSPLYQKLEAAIRPLDAAVAELAERV